MMVETLSTTVVDEVEYRLSACDVRYANEDEHLAKRAHYEVQVCRVDEYARGGQTKPYGGTIIGTVTFPFNAEGGKAARATYALLVEAAHVPLSRLAEGLLPRA